MFRYALFIRHENVFNFLTLVVGRNEEKRFVGSMQQPGNESDLDSSLELNDDDSDTESDLNNEKLMDDLGNVEALYNFSETTGARKSAKTKAYQSDEDF